VRISDLSRQTGIPVATIKFYLREHLIPPGEPTGRNQAAYGEQHLRRLLLIRAFTTIGKLDLTSVRELLTAIEDPAMPLAQLYDVVNRVLVPPEDPAPGELQGMTDSRNDVDGFLADRGWKVESEAPSREHLAMVLTALRRLGCDCGMDYFAPYAEAAEQLAGIELDLLVPDNPDRAAAVARSLMLDIAFGAMRRMAQENLVALRWGRAATGPA
jgi:DNA-binding transcriptional MerR regulator